MLFQVFPHILCPSFCPAAVLLQMSDRNWRFQRLIFGLFGSVSPETQRCLFAFISCTWKQAKGKGEGSRTMKMSHLVCGADVGTRWQLLQLQSVHCCLCVGASFWPVYGSNTLLIFSVLFALLFLQMSSSFLKMGLYLCRLKCCIINFHIHAVSLLLKLVLRFAFLGAWPLWLQEK